MGLDTDAEPRPHHHVIWRWIGTTWGWLRHLFASQRPDDRILNVYAPADSTVWQTRPAERYAIRLYFLDGGASLTQRVWRQLDEGSVRLNLRGNRIELPDGWINRTDGGWHEATDRRLGTCSVVACAYPMWSVGRVEPPQ